MVKKYDQDIYYTRSPFPIRMIEEIRIKKIVKLLSPLSHENILEVGCGTGNILKNIKYGRILGIDIAFSLLKALDHQDSI